MELAYLCRLRGIEVVTLTDENELESGILTNRRKGSRDNIVRWTPRLRKAWENAKTYRTKVVDQTKDSYPNLGVETIHHRSQPWGSTQEIQSGYSLAAVHHAGTCRRNYNARATVCPS